MSALDAFEWSPSLNCGVELIDQQHRNLLDLVNLLRGAIQRDDPVAAAMALESLKAYVGYHFAHEEEWARQHGMPSDALARHARGHQAFRHRVQQRGMISGPAREQLVELHAFLSSWLLDHIAREDRDMVRRLTSHAA